MHEIKILDSAPFREKLKLSVAFGFGAGVLTFFLLVVKDKLGMHWIYIPPKTWSQVIEGLPLIMAFSLGMSLVVLVGTLLFFKEEETVICPKCEEPFSKAEVPSLKCPKCGVGVVSIKGYYRNKKVKGEA